MKSVISWLLAFFMVIYWVFRIIVTLTGQFGGDFAGFITFNNTIEIILLFVSVLCFILILRRWVLGGIIYFGGYGFYFGQYIYSDFIVPMLNGDTVELAVTQNVLAAAVGLLLGLFILLNLIFERATKKHYSDTKTDWFFNNKNYEREMDERADKNQYRTL